MTHVTCRLTAKYRDQLRNPIRSVTEYGLPFTFYFHLEESSTKNVLTIVVFMLGDNLTTTMTVTTPSKHSAVSS